MKSGINKMVHKISVTILTKNSQKYLVQCLDALKKFDEVLILDNGSDDETLKIASSYANVMILEHPFIGFGPMKNLAAGKARNDWIFSVDSDEVASGELIEWIRKLDYTLINRVYTIDRINHYNGRPIRCCGWYPDTVLRLFNRTHTSFNDAMVHESLIMKSGTQKIELSGELKHYPFDDVASLINKMQRYSTLYAQQSSKTSSPMKAFWRATFSFFKNYFFQKGFLCGYEGLIISASNANGVFYKYMKLYEKQCGEKL